MTRRELSVERLAWSSASFEAWRALIERCPHAMAFQHPDWLVPWVAHLGGDADPYLLGVRREEALVGVAPLVRDGGVVRFAGGDVTDYRDVVALPEERDSVATAVLEHLARSALPCELRGVEASSPLLRAQTEGLVARAQDVCPYVPLRAGARAPKDVLPTGFARRLRATTKAAQRMGRLEVRWARPEDVGARLETFFALHAAWWQSRGEEGVLHADSVRAFWRAAAGPLLRAGWLWILELRLDERPIGSAIALARPGRVLFYLGGWEPSAAALSPGRLCIAALLDRALAEGARELDFLRGTESYKYRWGAVDRWTYTLTVGA
jgi:CelD/BcsL family acetyltransferase involved in cellulose biosynthesis